MNLGGASKVKYKSKSRELKANKAGTPVIKLLHFWRFMNRVAHFHTQLCVGFGMRNKKVLCDRKNIHESIHHFIPFFHFSSASPHP